MSKKYDKDFLDKHLEIWKTRESKKKKWVDNLKRHMNTVLNVKKSVEVVANLEPELFNVENFNEMKKYSKENSTHFLQYINDENVSKFLATSYLDNVKASYEKTYWGKQIIDKAKEIQSSNLTASGIDRLKSGKGPIILYLLIEHINSLLENNHREPLIKFYDNAIMLFRTPHSASSRRGLHFEVCNNNFITDLIDFFINANKQIYINELNGTYKYRSGDTSKFNEYKNENVAKELFGWINLGQRLDDKDEIVAIYNNKIANYIKKLMDVADDLNDIHAFYKLFYKYLNEKEPYPVGITDEVEKVLYADQFFQYIHELEIEELHKNIIYYGAPGTGKSYHVTKQLVDLLGIKDTNFKLVQFHPSYGYEDFIEGIKPKGITVDGNIRFELVNGEFKQFCIDASKKPFEKFYFIVDEINRAELSRTFGELLYCFEYRVQFEDDGSISYEKNKTNFLRTQYSNLIDSLENKSDLSLIVENEKSYFGIPENIHFIGTMNDIDRSIDSFDMALRRRFVWKRMDCDYEVIKEWLYERKINDEITQKYINACQLLNSYIAHELSLGTSYEIGHAYFMKLKIEDNSNNLNEEMLTELWNNNIKPLIHEYLRSEYNENDIGQYISKAKEKFMLNDNE